MTSLVCGVLSGVVLLLAYFVLGMPFAWAVVLGLGAFLGLGLLLGQTKSRAPARSEYQGLSAGEIARVLRDGQRRIGRIRSLARVVPNPALRQKIAGVCKAAERIYETFRTNPKNIKVAGRFMQQYLDAMALIIQRYADLSVRGGNNPEVQRALAGFGDLLDTVESAFQKQNDRLLSNDALDLDTEIEVLKKMVEMEGL